MTCTFILTFDVQNPNFAWHVFSLPRPMIYYCSVASPLPPPCDPLYPPPVCESCLLRRPGNYDEGFGKERHTKQWQNQQTQQDVTLSYSHSTGNRSLHGTRLLALTARLFSDNGLKFLTTEGFFWRRYISWELGPVSLVFTGVEISSYPLTRSNQKFPRVISCCSNLTQW
jgi:hypothetical protein